MLERIIRGLPGYRFYASSLLMLYDSAETHQPDGKTILSLSRRNSVDHEDAVSPPSGHSPNPPSSIKLKIVDFANCVTAEDGVPASAPCPPQEPDGVDKGYLRGLRSLRMYLRRIWQEITGMEWVERSQSDEIVIDDGDASV